MRPVDSAPDILGVTWKAARAKLEKGDFEYEVQVTGAPASNPEHATTPQKDRRVVRQRANARTVSVVLGSAANRIQPPENNNE
jgi:hypothetical protein